MKTELELDLYGSVGDPAGIDPAKVAALLRGAPDAKRINIRLNSAGGSAFDGVAIMNAIKDHPAKVTVKVDGLAASAASIIAMAGDTIEMGDGAFMMVHNVTAAAFGNADDMRDMAKTMGKINAELVDTIAKRCRKPVDVVRGWLDAETWFTGDEAVEAGLADKVVSDPGALARAVKALATAKGPIVDALHLPERLKNAIECAQAAKPAAKVQATAKPTPKAVTAKAKRNPFILSDVDNEVTGKVNPFAPKAGPVTGKPNPFRPKDGERPVPPGVARFMPKDDGGNAVNPFLPKDVD